MHKDDFQIKISITHKIMLLVILVLFVVVGISTYFAVKYESKVFTEELIYTGKNLAANIAASTKSAFWSLNWFFLEEQLAECPKSGRNEVIYAKIINLVIHKAKVIFFNSPEDDMAKHHRQFACKSLLMNKLLVALYA